MVVFRCFVLVLSFLCVFIVPSEAFAGRLPSSPGEAGRTIASTEKSARPVRLKLITDGKQKQITAPGNLTVEECLKRERIDIEKYHVSVPLQEKIKKGMIITLKPKTALEIMKEKQEKEKTVTRRQPSITGRHHAGSGAYLVVSTGKKFVKDEAGGLHRVVGCHLMEATAYLPEDGNGDGITATGVPATYGIAAVDPDIIPLGTRVFVPGYGIALAADVGGAIEGKTIDLCYEDYDEAIQFGRRDVEVYLLET